MSSPTARLPFLRRRARQRDLAEFYRLVVEAGDDIVSLIGPDGAVLYISAARERIFGWSEDELAERDSYSFVHVDDRETSRAQLAAAFAGGAPDPIQVRILHRDGTWRTLENSVQPVHGAEGRVRCLITRSRDVTERLGDERERLRLAEQIVEAQRLEAIGRLAGGVAHDFNNLLTAISGYAEFVQSELPQDDPLQADLDEIGRAAGRAAQLTRQLLAFGRKQLLQPVPLDLNVLVRDLEAMLRRLLGEDVELVTELGAGLGRVYADSARIAQAVIDLAGNARAAMPAGGTLLVQTRNAELAAPAGTLAPGSYVVLSLADTGVGMHEETRERIFEPFFTTHEQGKGSGLGLASVYGTVKQTGGEVRVQSEPGQGTRFDLWLPQLNAPRALAPTERPASVSSVGAAGETVLLVEDEERVRRVAARALAERGYSVLEAGHPEQALRLLTEHEGPIHVLVTDVVMPGMSGCELAEIVCVHRPGTEVLYISGYSQTTLIANGGPKKGARFLEKPFLPDTLARAVRGLLDDAGSSPSLATAA